MKKNNYQKVAKDVIQKEIDGLKKLKLYIGRSFDQIIRTIMSCKNGKIIVSGVGKSGIISKKWAATFSSTGTPSFFMDASNASHGDMGQIEKKDVLIIFSYSGNTSELSNMLRYANRNRIKIIGVASKPDSLLLKASDIKIVLPKVKESDVTGIVPTSSTSITLLLGDCLATTVMHQKKFSKVFKGFSGVAQEPPKS